MALSGSLSRTVIFRRAAAGELSFSGDQTSIRRKFALAVLSFAGELTSKVHFYRSTAGTLTLTGAATSGLQVFYRAVGGVLSFVGVGSRTQALLHKGVSGTLSFTGLAERFRSGMYGELTRMVIFRRGVSGAITPTGTASTLLEKFVKAAAGVVSFAGALGYRRKLFKNVEGQLGAFSLEDGGMFLLEDGEALLPESDLSGSLSWKVMFKRAASGSLSPTGSLAKQMKFRRLVAGVISFGGSLAGEWGLGEVAGVISFAGTLTRKVFFRKTTEGVVSFSADLTKTSAYRSRSVSGVLSFFGQTAIAAAIYAKKGLNKFGMNLKED